MPEDNSPHAVKQYRRRNIDGRTIRGVRLALEAALRDGETDKELRRLVDAGLNYSAVGYHLKISRQRATELVQRAVIRGVMLREHRAGKPIEEIAYAWTKIYPRKNSEQRPSERRKSSRGTGSVPVAPSGPVVPAGDEPTPEPDA